MDELLKIQSELIVGKDRLNSFGGFNYRSAEDILVAVKPLLKKYNCVLTMSDEVVNVGDRYYVRANAVISNKEGKGMSVFAVARESLEKKGMDSAQITGSASSYARKYALNGLFAIDDGKDPDGDDNRKEGTRKIENKTPSQIFKKVTMAQGKYLKTLGYDGDIEELSFDEADKQIKILTGQNGE